MFISIVLPPFPNISLSRDSSKWLHTEQNEWIYTLKYVYIHPYVVFHLKYLKRLIFRTEGVYGIFIPVVTVSVWGGAAVEQTHPPTGRRPSLELEERNEGGELAVARTLLSDGTRVDRIGVLSTRSSFFREKVVVCLVPLVGCVRPIPVITLGLLFEPQLRFTVHIVFTHLSSYMYS